MNDTDKRTKSQGFDNLNKKNDPYENISAGIYNEMKLREKDEDTENLKRLTNLFKFLVRCFILEQLGYDKLNRYEVSQYLCDLINPLPF